MASLERKVDDLRGEIHATFRWVTGMMLVKGSLLCLLFSCTGKEGWLHGITLGLQSDNRLHRVVVPRHRDISASITARTQRRCLKDWADPRGP